MTQGQFKELQAIVASFTTDEIIVTAIPKQIRNNGKPYDVIEMAVVHKATMEMVRFLYRESLSNLRSTLKQAIDELINTIHRKIVENPTKKSAPEPGFL